MRFLLIFSALFPFYSFSQTDSIFEYSRLEKMIMQPGSFVKINTDTLGRAGNISVGAITSVDMNTGQKQRSVCFITGNAFTSIIFSPTNLQVDIEELTPFINALTKMQEAVDAKKAEDLQMYQYTTSNLTVLSMGNRIFNKSKWDISIHKRYKNLNSIVPGTDLFLRGKDIGELVDILSRYRESLKGNLYD
jgi:hypothetical protein